MLWSSVSPMSVSNLQQPKLSFSSSSEYWRTLCGSVPKSMKSGKWFQVVFRSTLLPYLGHMSLLLISVICTSYHVLISSLFSMWSFALSWSYGVLIGLVFLTTTPFGLTEWQQKALWCFIISTKKITYSRYIIFLLGCISPITAKILPQL